MHTIKGGWVGQTFALAKFNDSGGKKSRIRRSKDERKAMVESFIKKYQNSNNGNFPSLNLTHKEVGGSFYTVREIVREIIQENRVLGPAKLTPEEQNTDPFSEQYPLGSISIEPQIHMTLSSNGTHFGPKHHQGTSEELVLNSNGQCSGPEHQRFDNRKIINGIQADGKKEEPDEPMHMELQVSEILEAEKNVLEELEACTEKITHMTADVIVETFPLRSVSEPTYSLDGRPGEASDTAGTLEEKETEKVEVQLGNNNSAVDRKNSMENYSGLVDEKALANLGVPSLEMNPGSVGEKAGPDLADPLLEISNRSTTREGIVRDIQDSRDLEIKVSRNDVLMSDTFEQSQAIVEIEPVNAPNGIHTKNLNAGNTSSTFGEPISQEAIVIENKTDVQHSGSSQKGSNPTLDRINLESWEGASEQSAEPETNPFWASFKAFIAAFVKFWSE